MDSILFDKCNWILDKLNRKVWKNKHFVSMEGQHGKQLVHRILYTLFMSMLQKAPNFFLSENEAGSWKG